MRKETLESLDDAIGLDRKPITIEMNENEIQVIDDVKELSKDLKKHQKHRDEDFEKARSSIANMMDIANQAIEDAGTIVKENPAYLFQFIEVMTPMLKTMSGASKDLLELQKMMDDLEGKVDELKPDGSKITNNNFFVGSTSDLSQMLKDENKNLLNLDDDDDNKEDDYNTE